MPRAWRSRLERELPEEEERLFLRRMLRMSFTITYCAGSIVPEDGVTRKERCSTDGSLESVSNSLPEEPHGVVG